MAGVVKVSGTCKWCFCPYDVDEDMDCRRNPSDWWHEPSFELDLRDSASIETWLAS